MEHSENNTGGSQLNKKKKVNKWNTNKETLPAPHNSNPALSDPQQLGPSPQTEIIPPNIGLQLDCQTKSFSQMSKTYHIEMSIELGSGFASVVYLGQNIHTHQIVCVKVIDCMALGNTDARQTLNREIKYLKQFNCDQIVKLIDVYSSPSFCYLIMEYCGGGDLFKFLMKQEGMHRLFVRQLIEQICLGLVELKKRSLIHRDLKTENIFLSKTLTAKIGDLGFCVTKDEENVIHNVGSPFYMSPEVMKGGRHSFESDIYGLAVIWYELLHRKAPWQAKTESELIEKKVTQKIQFKRVDLSQDQKLLISKCLSLDLKERATVEQILQFCQDLNKKELQKLKSQAQSSTNKQIQKPIQIVQKVYKNQGQQ